MAEDDRDGKLFTNVEAAKVTASIIWPGALMRILSLIAAAASVVGVLTFFFFESLVPYRWWLIGLGSAGSFLFGLIGDRITPTREDVASIDMNEVMQDALRDAESSDDKEVR